MINSASGIKTFQRCPQLWKYTYVDKKEPFDDSGFEAAYGRAFHGLCEGVLIEHFGAKWKAVITEHFNAYKQRWGPSHAKRWLVGYLEHELSFNLELASGYQYRGIVDAVVEMDGSNFLLETKTTGAVIDDYIAKMEHALQPALYLLAAKHSPELVHYDIQGLILDVTRRPGIRQKRGEDDDAFIQRVADWYFDNKETAFGRALITKSDNYLEDLAGELMMITDLQDQGLFAKNRDACYAFRRQCGFYPVCFQGDTLENEELYQIRKRR